MPSILNLKFKGNKSFVAFSNLNDTEALTKTWKVCTKVASYLEQGQRLENLSWRLWHLQNLMVDTDNAKSKREFKKLSKCMGDKLDKEKGRSIEELEAPDFKRNPSIDMIQQRAVEKERSREASHNALPGTIKRMQFTFSVDQPTPAANYPVKKPNLKPSAEFSKRTRSAVRTDDHDNNMVTVDDDGNDKDPPHPHLHRTPTAFALSANSSFNATALFSSSNDTTPQSLHFPSLFSNDFGPAALLFPTPTLTNTMNYGEGLNPSASNDGFSISRPTIELPLDELLSNVEADAAAERSWQAFSMMTDSTHAEQQQHLQTSPAQQQDVVMGPPPTAADSATVVAAAPPAPSADPRKVSPILQESEDDSNESDDEDSEFELKVTAPLPPPLAMPVTITPMTKTTRKRGASSASQAAKDFVPPAARVSQAHNARSNTPTARPTLTVRTQGSISTRSSGLGATATNVNSSSLRGPSGGSLGNNGPGGVKAECTNCGATHTPLWRRGLNDELNCNACGLYCKLHKRPRPKSMRNTHGEGRAQAAPRQESVDVMAQCYNCHTTATPLWRKDDEGKTVCNACGLYYKLHGSARPISMKSDVIRKRSRHDARRSANSDNTPSASPGVSRRPSPAREASPILAPDSTTQMTYEFNEEIEYRPSQSELLGALGPDLNQVQLFQSSYQSSFPGPYHPDYLIQLYTMPSDALPFTSIEHSDVDGSTSPRMNKRRRMSTDSASEPPSSAASYSSYNDSYSTPASSVTSHSQQNALEFPFSSYLGSSVPSGYCGGPALRGSGNTFWHPPMMPQGDNSPALLHPPMLPSDESPMDYLHPPMIQDDDSLFSTYLHPPMAIPDELGHNSSSSPSLHPPMYHDYGADAFDTSMRVY